MSFRGGSRGGDRGGRGGGRGGDRGGRGGRGGFGGGRGGFSQGPPPTVVHCATFSHACEDNLIAFSNKNDYGVFKVPLLGRMIYTQAKAEIGKVEDVFGTTESPGLCIQPSKNGGVQASSFKEGDKVSKSECQS